MLDPIVKTAMRREKNTRLRALRLKALALAAVAAAAVFFLVVGLGVKHLQLGDITRIQVISGCLLFGLGGLLHPNRNGLLISALLWATFQFFVGNGLGLVSKTPPTPIRSPETAISGGRTTGRARFFRRSPLGLYGEDHFGDDDDRGFTSGVGAADRGRLDGGFA